MSNRVYITPTEFKNVRTGKVSFGVRAYDDESEGFIDCWDDIPESNREVLQRVIGDAGGTIWDLLDYAKESGKGVYVGGELFSPAEIEQCDDLVQGFTDED